MIRLGLVALAVAGGTASPAVAQVPADSSVVVEMRPSDDWLGRDKAYHVAASFGIAVGTHVLLAEGVGATHGEAWPLAAASALTVGVFKEVADSRRTVRPLFSWRDLAADAAGVGLAVAVAALLPE